ncbi:DNA polymerase III subunit chi [uncultured Piscinibacter sp.]|uniref:DNA polymerase III subunit chi n=1 Tax=uncultured Piscinibacter sp. TaxID=1131835 RepID=UPI00262EB489|nr:DNA polymerase III subunit chi [uncultured Piscinibacter sp.]
MTRVSFHFNVPHRMGYACRLLRKATRQNARVAVAAAPAVLAELDRTLWSFEATEFVPHVLLREGETLPERLRDTPVCLLPSLGGAPHHDVLLNLGAEPPAGFESFQRLVEIVSVDEADRAAARARWKHYASRGYQIEKHEVDE